MDEKIAGTNDFELFLDKNVVINMWDGRLLYGILRSFDQYNSITLQNTFERQFEENKYCEKYLGLYVIRGENIVLIGISNLDLKRFVKVDKIENGDQLKLN